MKAINIGNLTFDQYIARRLRKDKLGFVPGTFLEEGCTDHKSYIKAVIPTSAKEFSVYAHELGHCKGKQKPRDMNSSMMYGTSETTLFNEFSAWDWALRYMRRVGIFLEKRELEYVLDLSLGSYIKNVPDSIHNYCNKLIDCFNKKYNVELRRPEIIKPWRDSYDTFFGKRRSMMDFESVVIKPSMKDTVLAGTWISVDECVIDDISSKGQKRKPWMEIVDQKNKEFYKRNGGKK